MLNVCPSRQPSLSARRAWIEISLKSGIGSSSSVALRKESVDRNTLPENPMVSVNKVALRKESVDRNRSSIKCAICRIKSLSARRAWIEILTSIIINQGYIVALRKESVDRNQTFQTAFCWPVWSLSARRAWIEICFSVPYRLKIAVALRKESVDRNIIRIAPINSVSSVALRKESVDRNVIGDVMGKALAGRSPQGERG